MNRRTCPRCAGRMFLDPDQTFTCISCGHIVYPFAPMDIPIGRNGAIGHNDRAGRLSSTPIKS